MKDYLERNKKYILIFFIICFTVFSSGFIRLTYKSYRYNKAYGHEQLSEETLNFPDNFLWGTATAAYQVEGGNVYSNWWDFEQEEGRIKNGDRSDISANHYVMYEEDIDLMSQMNMNSYRFSIEWSRIEPKQGEFNADEIDHYRDVLRVLSEKGITPMVTLWHHSLPYWFEDLGGWEKSDNIKYYEEYISYVVKNLNSEVDLWITMNEPMAYISCGYISAKWPPGEQDIWKVNRLLKNVIQAHKKGYEIIHANDQDATVGIAEHSSYAIPYHKKSVLENIAAYSIDYIWTHYLLEQITDELDFIGLHYYYRQYINRDSIKDLFGQSLDEFESGSMDRSYHPEGLFEVLMRFEKYDIPIYITELGVPDYHEIDRDQFIREHVREIYYAINEGIDVRGFYYWTLLDCFEWSEGYDAEFGLIDVNMATQERTIKEESWEYADIAKCNCVSNSSD